jgi:hypothetical protein
MRTNMKFVQRRYCFRSAARCRDRALAARVSGCQLYGGRHRDFECVYGSRATLDPKSREITAPPSSGANFKGLLFQKPVVIGVMANPNPDHQVAFSMRHSAIMDTDSGRIEAVLSDA